MPPSKASLGDRLKDLGAILTKSRTILPRKAQTFRDPNTWWPIAVIVAIMVAFTVTAMYYDPYSPRNMSAIKPLVSLDQMPPTPPHFAEGAAVRVRFSGTVYAGVETARLLQEPLPDNSGVVVDGVWKRGRWLYQVRFSPTLVGWVGEPDLIAAQ